MKRYLAPGALWLLLSVVFSNGLLASVESTTKLTFYTENYPPANYLMDGELVGVSTDTLKAMWRHMAVPEQDIHIVPWARGYRFTLNDPNSVLFTMSRTPSREKLFKWVGPVFSSTHVLIAKKSKNFNFENLGQVFYHKAAAVRGDISEISLNQVGFPEYNMAKVSDLKQAFLMLKSDRVDMMVVSIHGFSHLAKQLDFDANDYEQVWEINKIRNYLAFNLKTADVIIESYQRAFDEIAEERLQIKQSYQLPLAEY